MKMAERKRLAALLSAHSELLNVTELRTAILVINFGRDVSEVASLVALRPETVRRHLRQAWIKLKVRHDG